MFEKYVYLTLVDALLQFTNYDARKTVHGRN